MKTKTDWQGMQFPPQLHEQMTKHLSSLLCIHPGLMISDIILSRSWDLQALLCDGISTHPTGTRKTWTLINKNMKLGRIEHVLFFPLSLISVWWLLRCRKLNLVHTLKSNWLPVQTHFSQHNVPSSKHLRISRASHC